MRFKIKIKQEEYPITDEKALRVFKSHYGCLLKIEGEFVFVTEAMLIKNN